MKVAAVTWLKYCRYGVKHYPINQLINIDIESSLINPMNLNVFISCKQIYIVDSSF